MALGFEAVLFVKVLQLSFLKNHLIFVDPVRYNKSHYARSSSFHLYLLKRIVQFITDAQFIKMANYFLGPIFCLKNSLSDK